MAQAATYPVRILGTGHALPVTEVTSEAMDIRLGLAAGRLAQATGVIARRICTGEDQIDLATQAAERAIADAGWTGARST